MAAKPQQPGARPLWAGLAVWGVPTVLSLFNSFASANAWVVAWIWLPILVLVLVPRLLAFRRLEPFRLALGDIASVSPRALVGLMGFVAVFLGVSSCRGPQTPLVGYNHVTPRNWLSLDGLNDQLYRFAPRREISGKLVTLLVPPPGPQEQRNSYRHGLAMLVDRLAAANALGVALDVYFEGESDADPLLCQRIVAAEQDDGFRVFIAMRTAPGPLPSPLPAPLTLVTDEVSEGGTGCLGLKHHSHAIVLKEANGTTRSLPLGADGAVPYPALSLRVARQLRGDKLALPPDDYLYFVPPRGAVELDFSDLGEVLRRERPPTEAELARLGQLSSSGPVHQRFVLIGTKAAYDLWETPFSDAPVPGVRLHAQATEALLAGHWIVHASWLACAAGVFFACAGIVVLLSRSGGPGPLGVGAWTAVYLLVVLLVVVALLHLSGTWFDVSYALVGTVAFYGLAIGARRIAAGPERAG